jgi:hypothetical protein
LGRKLNAYARRVEGFGGRMVAADDRPGADQAGGLDDQIRSDLADQPLERPRIQTIDLFEPDRRIVTAGQHRDPPFHAGGVDVAEDQPLDAALPQQTAGDAQPDIAAAN